MAWLTKRLTTLLVGGTVYRIGYDYDAVDDDGGEDDDADVEVL